MDRVISHPEVDERRIFSRRLMARPMLMRLSPITPSPTREATPVPDGAHIEVVDDGDAILETLKTLQDALGDLHDVHVFSEEVMTAVGQAAVSVARRVAEVEPGDEKGDGRVRRSLVARARSRAPSPRAPPARARSARLRWHHARLAERCRSTVLRSRPRPGRRDHAPRSGGHRDRTQVPSRTTAGGGARRLERLELEEEADAALGRALWRLTKGRRVHKRRYSIREAGDVVWEIDEFLDRTLVIAEIELPAVDTGVELPPWLRAVMDREVTDELEYANARLAQ